jgi:hypothetical protein
VIQTTICTCQADDIVPKYAYPPEDPKALVDSTNSARKNGSLQGKRKTVPHARYHMKLMLFAPYQSVVTPTSQKPRQLIPRDTVL